ncbi:MAG: hypothetical protein WCZ86_03850 [Desulfurivibrionaceae bacterium]
MQKDTELVGLEVRVRPLYTNEFVTSKVSSVFRFNQKPVLVLESGHQVSPEECCLLDGEPLFSNDPSTFYFSGAHRRGWTCPNCRQPNSLADLTIKESHRKIVALFMGDSLCIHCKHCKDSTLLTLRGDASLVAHNPLPEDTGCACGRDSLGS